MKYEIVEGRMATPSLESHVTDHCNLRCRQCCSLSPYLPHWSLDPEALRRDLELCKGALRPYRFKLVGGEPLLHPRLLECVEIVRRSGIAESVSLTTNGWLLPRMAEAVWRLLDHMTLSIYPSPRLSESRLDWIRRCASRFDVDLNIKVQDQFQVMHTSWREDEGETRQIFSQCWLRRRCHMVRQGWFYTCTLPPHFHTYFQGRGDFGLVDGVRLHRGSGLAAEIRDYLQRQEPLMSCRLCQGGSGEKFDHRQLTLEETRRPWGVPA